jgi:hypothetical protein
VDAVAALARGQQARAALALAVDAGAALALAVNTGACPADACYTRHVAPRFARAWQQGRPQDAGREESFWAFWRESVRYAKHANATPAVSLESPVGCVQASSLVLTIIVLADDQRLARRGLRPLCRLRQ